jgi:hypothetical protein
LHETLLTWNGEIDLGSKIGCVLGGHASYVDL